MLPLLKIQNIPWKFIVFLVTSLCLVETTFAFPKGAEAWTIQHAAEAQKEAWKLIDKGDSLANLSSSKGCSSSLFKNQPHQSCFKKLLPEKSYHLPSQQTLERIPRGTENRLLVFVSFSMPEVSLKSLFQQAKKHNAVLVLRGLYQDSFVKTSQKLQEMEITVEINPELFDTHNITIVPTFIRLKAEKTYSILKGNVSLDFAVKKFETES